MSEIQLRQDFFVARIDLLSLEADSIGDLGRWPRRCVCGFSDSPTRLFVFAPRFRFSTWVFGGSDFVCSAFDSGTEQSRSRVLISNTSVSKLCVIEWRHGEIINFVEHNVVKSTRNYVVDMRTSHRSRKCPLTIIRHIIQHIARKYYHPNPNLVEIIYCVNCALQNVVAKSGVHFLCCSACNIHLSASQIFCILISNMSNTELVSNQHCQIVFRKRSNVSILKFTL